MGRTVARALAALVIIATFCLLRWGDSVGEFFFLDDYWLITTATRIRFDNISDLWQVFVPSHAGFLLYRPLTQAGYFVVLGHLFGVDAAGYHAVHLLASIACACLVFGLAWRLTASWAGGLATALLYAASPGLIVAAFWLAAFTMVGSALALFLLLWCWLSTAGWWRRVGCTVLQAVALLASEHAVVGPLLLAALEWTKPAPRRWRDLAGPTALVACYLLAKAIYFAVAGAPSGGYALSLDPRLWLTSLGYYAAACLNMLTLNVETPPGWMRLGAVVLVVALATIALAWRAPRWRIAAAGWVLFIGGLLPVLPLADHRYAYFIGFAGFGAWLAVVATCQQLGRWWRPLVLAFCAIVAITEWSTSEAASRDAIFHLVVKGGRAWGVWYAAVDAAARDPQAKVILVPSNPVTERAFNQSHVEWLFMQRPVNVRLSPRGQRPTPQPGEIEVNFAPNVLPPGYAWPGSGGRWHWVYDLLAAPRRALLGALEPTTPPVGTAPASG